MMDISAAFESRLPVTRRSKYVVWMLRKVEKSRCGDGAVMEPEAVIVLEAVAEVLLCDVGIVDAE